MNTNSCIGNIRKNILHNKEMIMYSNWFLNFLIPYKGTFFKYDAELIVGPVVVHKTSVHVIIF